MTLKRLMSNLNSNSRVFIASTKTVAGQALANHLIQLGYSNLKTDASGSVNLQNLQDTETFFKNFRPEFVFFLGANSLGIFANQKHGVALLTENSIAACNLFQAAAKTAPEKILYLASSCIYPVNAPQPMKPEYLGSGPLEPTNAPYALAKILGLELAKAYTRQYGLKAITAIPADVYGPENSFDLENSHVVEALIRKIHEAKKRNLAEVSIWGSGEPLRDFLYSRDLAEACVFLMQNHNSVEPVNISAGNPCTIKFLAQKIAEIVEFKGKFAYDLSKPEGMPKKTLCPGKINSLGWKAKTKFEDGLRSTYQAFLKQETVLSHA